MPTKAKKKPRKHYSAPALEKGLDIIELLASEREALSASVIAERLERSVGEIFRMLMVLNQRGYLSSTDSDKHLLSMKLFTVATEHAPIRRLTRAATHVMSRLAAETAQSCHLVVYNAGRGIVVAQVESSADRVHSVKLGAEAPLIESCSGHLLLAYADSADRQQMLLDQPDHLRKRAARSKLDAIIESVLRRGYESIDSLQVAGVRDIGYPIFDNRQKMVAALVMPYLRFLDGSEKVKLQAARAALADAAMEISQSMGYTAP